jgi:hypothetical protein
MRDKKHRLIRLTPLMVLAIAGCTVAGNEHEVSVDHLADKFAVAEIAARQHCEKFDRVAKHVQTKPIKSDSTSLFLQTRTSIFDCVER